MSYIFLLTLMHCLLMLRMLIYQGREINTDADIYKILSKRMTPQKDVLFGGAGSDDIKGGAGDDLILGDAQYSVASRVMALPYAGAGTRSYSWNEATQDFQQARTDGAYAMNPVVVPNGRIHEWDWQAEPHGTGYRFTLGAGISFMQQRVADDDNWPQTFFLPSTEYAVHRSNIAFYRILGLKSGNRSRFS